MLTQKTLHKGVAELAERDSDLAKIVKTHGLPPLWAREPGFATLVHIILEQQVSLASAKAAFNRLQEAVLFSLSPNNFLTLDDAKLRTIGFSRQKMTYCQHLAQAILRGFNLALLPHLDDVTVRSELLKIKGIGPWTADIYLLMALRRPDIWPRGDLALTVAVQRLKGLARRPSQEEMISLARRWRPLRAIAARLLWHDYLSNTKVTF